MSFQKSKCFWLREAPGVQNPDGTREDYTRSSIPLLVDHSPTQPCNLTYRSDMSEGLKVNIYVTDLVQVPVFRQLHVHVNIHLCLCGWTCVAFLYMHVYRQISLCFCMCMHMCRHAIHVCACIRHIHLGIQDACVCGCGSACVCTLYSLGGLKHFPEPGPGQRGSTINLLFSPWGWSKMKLVFHFYTRRRSALIFPLFWLFTLEACF